MGDPVQTARVIRSALEDLAADNAHHTFEHICREVATARLVSNILPATGPVSAGGDQGRDFETFHTYLAEELPFSIGFLALATTDTVVFACTIQRTKLKSKFQRDIESICTQGTPVDRIYIFVTANVATKLRHEVQDWAKRTYDVALEIIDKAPLARWLAMPDLYWVAVQYLDLHPDLAPQTDLIDPDPELPQWYVELRDYWQRPNCQPVNLGDLFDLQEGLRHAIPPGPARANLDGWLTLMTRLAEETPDLNTRLHATYEIVAARYRGTADLRPAEALIRRFIEEIEQSDDPALLFDASILVQFCSTAATCGHTDISLAETASWVQPLRRHLDALLEQQWGPNTRAGLLQVAAHLAMHLDYTDIEGQSTATLDDIDELYESLMNSIDNGIAQTHLEATELTPLVDLDAAMRHITDLVELLPSAPAYPIDTFSLTIDLLAPTLRDHPLYRTMCDGLDAAVARQEGDAAAGERCLQRAHAFDKAGRPLDALREYHQAKVRWFHGDTLYGALTAIASIIDIYSTLGMYLAAKKYSLALASLANGSADPSDRVYVPIALFSASNMDHLAGAWIASARLATIAGQAQLAYAPDADNLERHAYLTESMKYQALAIAIARQARPEFIPPLHAIYRGGLFDGFTHPHDHAELTTPQTEQQWTDQLHGKAGAPFSDTGPRRTIAFHALGIRWSLHGENTQDTVLALEDFTSVLQISLVHLATLDPLFMAQAVDIEIRTYRSDDPRPDRTCLTRTQDGQRHWLLFLPIPPQGREVSVPLAPEENLRLVFIVLNTLSLLSQEDFVRLMDQAVDDGLMSNIEIGGPYSELARFYDEPTPPLSDPTHRPVINSERPNPRVGALQLQPRTGPGPGYSLAKAHTILADRYEVLPVSIRRTIPQLLDATHVRTLFQQLRNEGWKDWHLLSVVANLTVNHRLTLRYGPITSDRMPQLAQEFHAELTREEQVDDPQIAPEAIDRDIMDKSIHSVAMSSLPRWGLTVPQRAPNPAAITQILADRYGFWEDDTAHPDLFDGRLHESGENSLSSTSPPVSPA
ncbi:hypothetical protein [Nocardia arizonensis]|uniref:hypothetical protein n=1 Tax=Nocardia arizonensis TaxID=1141647 RepID=UPI0006CF659A|nr:hypothetical protein [Nocardia arizonensis]